MASLDELYAKKAPQSQPQPKAPLDLNQELLAQYEKAQTMLRDAELEEAPLNYRVQALNAISSIINQIVKMQTDLHTLEEIKKIEGALVAALKKFPDLQQEFLDEYKGALDL